MQDHLLEWDPHSPLTSPLFSSPHSYSHRDVDTLDGWVEQHSSDDETQTEEERTAALQPRCAQIDPQIKPRSARASGTLNDLNWGCNSRDPPRSSREQPRPTRDQTGGASGQSWSCYRAGAVAAASSSALGAPAWLVPDGKTWHDGLSVSGSSRGSRHNSTQDGQGKPDPQGMVGGNVRWGGSTSNLIQPCPWHVQPDPARPTQPCPPNPTLPVEFIPGRVLQYSPSRPITPCAGWPQRFYRCLSRWSHRSPREARRSRGGI